MGNSVQGISLAGMKIKGGVVKVDRANRRILTTVQVVCPKCNGVVTEFNHVDHRAGA